MGAIAEARKTIRPRLCAFGLMLDKHADADDIEALKDPKMRHIDVLEVVETEAWGEVSADLIGRHRTGKCACARNGK